MAIQAYIDGACSGNPGPGGWGVLILADGEERVLSAYQPDTTNNRMELTAAIRLLQHLSPDVAVTIYADSQYVVKGVTEWMQGWKRNGWRNSQKKAVENRDLWETLDALVSERGSRILTWQWVRGHNGHPQNERVDQIAVAAMRSRKADDGVASVASVTGSAPIPAAAPAAPPSMTYTREALALGTAIFHLDVEGVRIVIAVVQTPDGFTLETRLHPRDIGALSKAKALFDALSVPDSVSADFVEITLLRHGATDASRASA